VCVYTGTKITIEELSNNYNYWRYACSDREGEREGGREGGKEGESGRGRERGREGERERVRRISRVREGGREGGGRGGPLNKENQSSAFRFLLFCSNICIDYELMN